MRWKTIARFPNYQVSDTGAVKRIHHVVEHKKYGTRRLCERLMNPRENDFGYPSVRIATKQVFVHRLVLEAFVGECPQGMVCIHNNGIRSDNNLSNLRWDYPKNSTHDSRFNKEAKPVVKKVIGPWDYICGLKVA